MYSISVYILSNLPLLSAVNTTLNFSLVLTSIRLIAAPLIVPWLLVYYLPQNSLVINLILAVFCGLLALTDFFDGYYARRYGQTTLLGAMLDPIADKFLLFSLLVSLLAVNKIFFFWVILFIGREFYIMGLRHIALEQQRIIAVTNSAKIKTTLQMLYCLVAIANPYYWSVDFSLINLMQSTLLGISLWLTLYTAYEYTREFFKKVSIV